MKTILARGGVEPRRLSTLRLTNIITNIIRMAPLTDEATASDLLKSYDARLMRCYPISTRINSVVNDDEACSAPVELAQIQNRLFL
jgi:hypothetical protein